MKRQILFYALVAVTLSVQGAETESGIRLPDTVDLSTVLRVAREVSPRLELERQSIEQARADRVTAGVYPNPTVTFGRAQQGGGQSTVFSGSAQQDAAFELPLLIAGQRGARIERAEREIEAARARVNAGASTLAGEAGAAFVALLAAQEKAALLSASATDIARLRDIVAGREASGAASRYDVARLDVEMGSLRARLEEARAEVVDRSGNLAALLGLPDWRPSAAGALAPMAFRGAAPIPPAERALSAPASIAAAREQATAESAVEVARRERWPVPAVSVGRTWTNDPYGAANRLGLTVEVPVFDTRRGPLARAQADAHAASLRRNLVTAELAANMQRLDNVIGARRTALERFEQDAGARLPALKQMAEDAYRLGRGSILELLDATRSRYELQQIRIDLTAALAEAQVRLAALSGDLDPQSRSASGTR
ncbi:MAG TPA: TolC family protein [Burkholderiales bacterium]|nr:TolC family protein [Burkholderiales bacterium]